MSKIHLKDIVMEDFCNYQKPSMFLITSHCNWKCCLEQHLDVSICQNQKISKFPIKEFDIEKLFDVYMKNDISKSIVFGGLEPLMQIEEVLEFISYFRDRGCNDDIVVYTGYTEEEIKNNILWFKLTQFNNIIIKYGRFIPNDNPHLDKILGIELASNNQYAVRY